MADKVRFAIVGCGKNSKKHCESIKFNCEEADLVAVCDSNEERASETARRYNVKWYKNYHEMIQNRPEIDVVNVLTPSGDHAKHVLDIAKYRKHIVVEKPMALTIEDAEKMIRECQIMEIKLFVVQQNRYNKPIKMLKKAIEENRFGKLVLGTVRVRWCRRQEYYDQDDWRGTWLKDGGVLTNQASHHIDLLTWMMGDVESLFAYTATRLVNIETEDTSVVAIKFVNGALGIIEATTATRPKDLEGSISILGERGSVVIGGFAADRLVTWEFEDYNHNDDLIMEESGCNSDISGYGHIEYLKDVVKSIKYNKSGVVDGLEGIKSLMLINAIYESVETGREIVLHFRPRNVRLGRV